MTTLGTIIDARAEETFPFSTETRLIPAIYSVLAAAVRQIRAVPHRERNDQEREALRLIGGILSEMRDRVSSQMSLEEGMRDSQRELVICMRASLEQLHQIGACAVPNDEAILRAATIATDIVQMGISALAAILPHEADRAAELHRMPRTLSRIILQACTYAGLRLEDTTACMFMEQAVLIACDDNPSEGDAGNTQITDHEDTQHAVTDDAVPGVLITYDAKPPNGPELPKKPVRHDIACSALVEDLPEGYAYGHLHREYGRDGPEYSLWISDSLQIPFPSGLCDALREQLGVELSELVGTELVVEHDNNGQIRDATCVFTASEWAVESAWRQSQRGE